MAHHDALTDLPNRVLFRETLEHALAFARRGHLLALHCLDLDQFKAVNDTLGHPIGDGLLQAVAEAAARTACATPTRSPGSAATNSPSCRPRSNRRSMPPRLASRLIELIEAPFEIDGHQIVIGTSIGIAFAPQDGLDADELLKNADLALYRAKFDGRGVYRLFQTAMDAEMQARRLLELDLRQALRRGQFELFYQPLIDLSRQAVAGFEALLRWHHPERGHGPARPVHSACRGDRRDRADRRMGAAAGLRWRPRHGRTRCASRSICRRCSSRAATSSARSPPHCATAGLAPDRLELEITETVMLQDTDGNAGHAA